MVKGRSSSSPYHKKLSMSKSTENLNTGLLAHPTFQTKLTKLFNTNTKILEKKDIIEIVLSENHLTDDEIFHIIISFYGDLLKHNLENKYLFSTLILYERIDIFDMLISHCNRLLESGAYGFIEDEIDDDESIENFTHNEEVKNVYDYDEIISDAFSYSIFKNKLNISFYLFKNYKRSIFGNKDVCIESITNSLKQETSQSNKIMFANERLFILQHMTGFIDHSQCYELLSLFEEIINENPDSNFLVYSVNPLLIIMKMIII